MNHKRILPPFAELVETMMAVNPASTSGVLTVTNQAHFFQMPFINKEKVWKKAPIIHIQVVIQKPKKQ
jgi:hypothetical protein